MKIGNLNIADPVFLAPMAGYTNLPFRLMAKAYGAGAVITEMVSAKGLYYRDKKTASLMVTCEEESPAGLQIFGSDPGVIEEVVAKYTNETPFAFLDFNAGCPAPKIVKGGDGSALMQNPKLLGEIIKRIKKVSNKPVTVKTRIGWDAHSVNIREVADVIAEAGADAHTIHGRTRSAYYSGEANWDVIADVAKHSPIPIILNGDINSGEKAREAFERTGCAGIMVGRAAVGNPFIFREIAAALKGEPIPDPPTPAEQIQAALKHANLLEKALYQPAAVMEMRKHLVAYTKGLKNAAALRTQIFQTETKEAICGLLLEYERENNF